MYSYTAVHVHIHWVWLCSGVVLLLQGLPATRWLRENRYYTVHVLFRTEYSANIHIHLHVNDSGCSRVCTRVEGACNYRKLSRAYRRARKLPNKEVFRRSRMQLYGLLIDTLPLTFLHSCTSAQCFCVQYI